MADGLRNGQGWIAAIGVGDKQGIRGDDRSERLLQAIGVESGQRRAGRCAAALSGNQDRYLLARKPALTGFSAATACLAVQFPVSFPALDHEGLVGLDHPAAPVWSLPNRLASGGANETPCSPQPRTVRTASLCAKASPKDSLRSCRADPKVAYRSPRRMSSPNFALVTPQLRAPCSARPLRHCLNAGRGAFRSRQVRSPPARPRVRTPQQHRQCCLTLRRRQTVHIRKPVLKPIAIHLLALSKSGKFYDDAYEMRTES